MTSDTTTSHGDDLMIAEGDAPARIAGFVVDSAIVSVAALFLLTVLGVLHGPVVEVQGSGDLPDRLDVDTVRFAIDSVVVSLFAGCYFAGSWIRFGATPGQSSVGLRVLDAAGGRDMSPAQAAIRFVALGAPLWLIGGLVSGNARLAAWCLTLVWYGVLVVTVVRGSSVSGIHDRIARTIVVREVTPIPNRMPGSEVVPDN